jgi:hypothetical protein
MNELILYKNPDNSLQVEIAFEGDTFWLSLNQIALLFERYKSLIYRNIKNILIERELTREEVFRTVAKNATVQVEGKRAIKREILYIIFAVGYSLSSIKGTQFRIWATKKLNEYLSKGFLINYKQIEKNKVQFL